MKIYDLAKELQVTSKELIEFLKENGFKVVSHLQPATDEMIDLARANLKPSNPNKEDKIEDISEILPTKESKREVKEERPLKKFEPDDVILCRSVTPYKLLAVGVDKNTVYHWNGYGDVDYLAFRDLQALRRSDYVTKPLFIIEDADLCYQWRRELGETYKYFLGVDYPEEFFELSDEKFERLLKDAPNVMKEVIKTTAISMIRGENYPSIQKLTLIDLILGTCLKEFI